MKPLSKLHAEAIEKAKTEQPKWKPVYIGSGDWDLDGAVTREDWELAASAPELLAKIEADEALLRQALSAIHKVLSGGDFDHPYAELKQAAAAIEERLK